MACPINGSSLTSADRQAVVYVAASLAVTETKKALNRELFRYIEGRKENYLNKPILRSEMASRQPPSHSDLASAF